MRVVPVNDVETKGAWKAAFNGFPGDAKVGFACESPRCAWRTMTHSPKPFT